MLSVSKEMSIKIKGLLTNSVNEIELKKRSFYEMYSFRWWKAGNRMWGIPF